MCTVCGIVKCGNAKFHSNICERNYLLMFVPEVTAKFIPDNWIRMNFFHKCSIISFTGHTFNFVYVTGDS